MKIFCLRIKKILGKFHKFRVVFLNNLRYVIHFLATPLSPHDYIFSADFEVFFTNSDVSFFIISEGRNCWFLCKQLENVKSQKGVERKTGKNTKTEPCLLKD